MPSIRVSLDAVIVAVTEAAPRLLTVGDALPSGPLDAAHDETLEKGMRRLVTAQAGIELGYVEQLYTFGDLRRDPRVQAGGPRHLSIAYLALIKEDTPLPGAAWRDWYELLPWEDRRRDTAYVDRRMAPLVRAWIAAAASRRVRDARRARAAVAFALAPSPRRSPIAAPIHRRRCRRRWRWRATIGGLRRRPSDGCGARSPTGPSSSSCCPRRSR